MRIPDDEWTAAAVARKLIPEKMEVKEYYQSLDKFIKAAGQEQHNQLKSRDPVAAANNILELEAAIKKGTELRNLIVSIAQNIV